MIISNRQITLRILILAVAAALAACGGQPAGVATGASDGEAKGDSIKLNDGRTITFPAEGANLARWIASELPVEDVRAIDAACTRMREKAEPMTERVDAVCDFPGTKGR